MLPTHNLHMLNTITHDYNVVLPAQHIAALLAVLKTVSDKIALIDSLKRIKHCHGHQIAALVTESLLLEVVLPP